jgi:uncharacterized protein (DUF433 family)
MMRRMTSHSYLGHGLYSISDAAQIIRVPAGRLRHWVRGYYYGPALARKRQVSVVPRFYGGDEEPLAFVELIELLFVAEFQQAGLSMQYIRRAAARARQEFDTLYPFAVRRFATDGREIFTTVAIQEQPKTATYEIVHGQSVFSSIIRRYFRYHLDIEKEFANRYWPLGRKQRVVLDAARAFGAPIDEPTGVPTEALVAALEAGDSEEDVAAWFEVPLQAVRTALKYERRPVAS